MNTPYIKKCWTFHFCGKNTYLIFIKKRLTDRLWFTRNNNTVYLYWKQALKLVQLSRCKVSNM